MPRISILLTCYNHLQFLPVAWEGIWRQTYRDFEVIAIDDGSADGTREWLASRDEPHTRILNEKNLGTYASLNRALERSNGEVIAVLNDDDVWKPEKLQKQVELLDAKPKVGLVHTDGWFIDANDEPMKGTPLGFEFPRFETGDVLLDLVYQNKIIASAALVRRVCFDRMGAWDPQFFGSGDWQMWFRVAEQWHVGFVPEPLTMYRVHGGNASHKLEKIWRDDQMLREWMTERLDSLPANRFNEVRLRDAKAHNWAALGTVRTLNGDPASGRAAYRESMRLMPGRIKSWMRYAATYLPPNMFRKML